MFQKVKKCKVADRSRNLCLELKTRSSSLERRQKQIEDEFGIELNGGKTRNERQESARDREQNWIRNADFPGDERKQRDGHETNQN